MMTNDDEDGNGNFMIIFIIALNFNSCEIVISIIYYILGYIYVVGIEIMRKTYV